MYSQVLVAVIGGSNCSQEIYHLAQEVGREIAQRGHILICGGLTGVMEAACKGAKGAGGTTVGILPGEDIREANPYIDIPIATGIGYARNAIVARSAAAVIAVGGEYGTLSEVAYSLGYALPVIGLRTWTLTRPNGLPESAIIVAETAAEAVGKAVAAVKQRGAVEQAG